VITLGHSIKLAVEVVSTNWETDYARKVEEYALLGIPEYWIVDPVAQVITICTLIEGRYQDREFRGDESLVSATFTELSLTAAQVLNPS